MRNPTAITFPLAMAFAMMSASLAQPQSSPSSDPADAGKAIFKRANCFGCHKWHGNGGGGYGGDALSLRKAELTRDQIIETVACGRPGTGMPPEGGVFLRAPDIEAVADYVLSHIKGKGEPNYDECVSFFGSTSRVCDIYKVGSVSPSKSLPGTEPAK
jgi:mono/diheme cytochrome c family protein